MARQDEWDLIHAYTRKQAVEDGVLVDVTETAREAGYRVPVALTRAVWVEFAEFVAVPQGVEGQDEAGRLWDVLWMCRFGIGRGELDRSEVLRTVVHQKGLADGLPRVG